MSLVQKLNTIIYSSNLLISIPKYKKVIAKQIQYDIFVKKHCVSIAEINFSFKFIYPIRMNYFLKYSLEFGGGGRGIFMDYFGQQTGPSYCRKKFWYQIWRKSVISFLVECKYIFHPETSSLCQQSQNFFLIVSLYEYT